MDSEDARWGHKMGNFKLVDAMYRDGFFCPLSQLIMGQTAEVLARQYGITREESDAFALGSQQKAEAAIAAGRFEDEITAGAREGRQGQAGRTRGRRASARRARRSKVCASCRWSSNRWTAWPGIITAGTSSGITDGGAAVVLARQAKLRAAA